MVVARVMAMALDDLGSERSWAINAVLQVFLNVVFNTLFGECFGYDGDVEYREYDGAKNHPKGKSVTGIA